MEDEIFNIRLPEVKRDLSQAIIECQKRGLVHTTKWLAEMNFGLSHIELETPAGVEFHATVPLGISQKDYDHYYLARSYFDTREYDRAAHFTRNCESPVPKFLHFYSTYMAKEKRRLDNITDASNLNDTPNIKDLSELMAVLKAEYAKRCLDGYGLYLYGVILKKFNLNHLAINVFLESLHATPLLWASYLELAPLISGKEQLVALNLPNNWMKHVFLGHAYIELYLNDEGLKQYEDLQSAGFNKCIYITSQTAIAYHNKRDVDKAIEVFETIQETDPYRLENLDTFSNLLFVKELRTEMAALAHKSMKINKYAPETCCVIGNYYSIRCDHQKAIIYFQRALKLNPQYLSAWTLMGHEFMELKNTNAAIQSYRKAVEVNKRDYRAWYGLGQAYEILKMHYYSLYYFKIAHQLRPYDSRMLVALGETFEKLDKTTNAIKCLQKACNVGDIEGIALSKLAGLYQKLGDMNNAVASLLEFTNDERAVADKPTLYNAYITLANYYLDKDMYDEASHFAYKCLESDEKKTEAKSLLKTIENKRSLAVPVVDDPAAEVSMNESEMQTEDNFPPLTAQNTTIPNPAENDDIVEDSQPGDVSPSDVSMDMSMD